MKLDFVNLHVHNDFSTYDGFGKSKLLAEKAANLGQKSLAITNHGNISGFVEHYYACKDVDVKPILGVEAYIVNIDEFNDDTNSLPYYHICLFAKNKRGYVNLMKLMTKANMFGFYRKPRINLGWLEEYSEGLVCSTACCIGLVPALLNEGKFDEALKRAKFLKGIFKDDLYFEVMSHDMANQNKTNKLVLKLSEKLKIKCIMTVDSHYIDEKDFDVHKSLVQMKNDKFEGYRGAFLSSANDIKKYWGKNHSNLGDCTEYIKNTIEVADKCNVNLDFGNLMPSLNIANSQEMLFNITVKKLKTLNKYNRKYLDRLRSELEVINNKGYSDYFLICYDATQYAIRNSILTGFGRGSVGGSLVAYLLDITKIDPLIHGTLFERFLREDKATMPDIDMDFDATKRHLVIDYLLDKFQDKAAQIISFGKWQVRNTIGDLCKVFGCLDAKDELSERIKLVIGDDEVEEVKIEHLVEDELLMKVDKESDILKYFCKMYGQMHLFGKHASGVAISKYKIKNICSLMKNANSVVTAYDKFSLEKMNILKLDILGLGTLSVLSDVEEMTGCKFDEGILTNSKVIDAYRNLEITGIFQFDSYGGKKTLEKIKPNSFEEVVACTAINRPGPLELGVLAEYVDGKNNISTGKKEFWYDFFKDTYGQIIYQEQIMKLCRDFAGMDWSLADKMMKNFKKKGQEKELKDAFVKGAMENNYTKQQAKELFGKITSYTFNKSHAVAYITVSFYMMWVSITYPLEYYYALLKREADDKKIRRFESSAVNKGVIIWLPHVNGSARYSIETIDGGRVIREGLTNIDGIGEKTAECIINNGPYTCEDLVVQRVPKRILTSAVLASLRDSGALEFNKNKFAKRCESYNGSLDNLYKIKYSKGIL